MAVIGPPDRQPERPGLGGCGTAAILMPRPKPNAPINPE